ncbi:hypothetical protein HDV01_006960 [Terramyces sp. JEL0728]|nr:hypothetical protein HDV01_006960 [Terramyces sp. JEL0728]
MHLVVLQHGLWGNTTHVETIIPHLKEKHADLVFLNIETNQGNLTYDGIDICGDRVVKDIHTFIETNPIDQISFIGYSLGGLILRYVIGKLYNAGFFSNVTPMNFVTLATPNLGTSRKQSVFNDIFNSIQTNALVRVGYQFNVRDMYIDGKPLLAVMADPEYDFFKGLALFKRRACFANILGDRSVRYCTASITGTNPYNRYEAKIIDDDYPQIVAPDESKIKQPVPWTTSDIAPTALKMVAVPILVPLWLTVATLGLGFNATRARIRQHSLTIENTWVKASREEINQGTSSEYVNQPSVESIDQANPTEENVVLITTEKAEIIVQSDAAREELDESVRDEETARDEIADNEVDIKQRTVREEMIHNLNQLEWIKVDVHNDKAFNAHAAIVLRKPFNSEENRYPLVYLANKVFHN